MGILKDLAIKIDFLSEKDQFKVNELIGGVFEINVTRAVLHSLKSI